MNADLQIRNTIKYNEIFLGLDFDFALKISWKDSGDFQQYEATANLIDYWLERDIGSQKDIIEHYFLHHIIEGAR